MFLIWWYVPARKRNEEAGHEKNSHTYFCLAGSFSLAACGNTRQDAEGNLPAETESLTSSAESDENADQTEESAENEQTSDTVESENSNILIAYFSVMETDGVDTVAGASRVAVDGQVLGNNQYIAQLIQQETGGDLFSIKTVQDYPATHDPLLDFAHEEQGRKMPDQSCPLR